MQTTWIWIRCLITWHLIQIKAVWHPDNFFTNFKLHWSTLKIEAERNLVDIVFLKKKRDFEKKSHLRDSNQGPLDYKTCFNHGWWYRDSSKYNLNQMLLITKILQKRGNRSLKINVKNIKALTRYLRKHFSCFSSMYMMSCLYTCTVNMLCHFCIYYGNRHVIVFA